MCRFRCLFADPFTAANRSEPQLMRDDRFAISGKLLRLGSKNPETDAAGRETRILFGLRLVLKCLKTVEQASLKGVFTRRFL
jgi:hypothetical protein